MQTIHLPQQSLASLSGNAQQWIACDLGTVWISDDGHDVVLQSGEKWQICSNHLVVIESLQESRLSLQTQQAFTPSIAQFLQDQCASIVRLLAHKPAVKTI